MRGYAERSPQFASVQWLRVGLIGYLAVLAIAELAVTYANPVLVFPLHGGLILLTGAFFVLAQRPGDEAFSRLIAAALLALAVAPLIRIISLTLPLAQLDSGYRYLFAGIPMAAGGLLAARASGLRFREIGFAWHVPPLQARVILASVALGFIEYLILRSDPIGPFPWTVQGFLPALTVGVFTGFPEELIFRGVMQTVLRPLLGRWNWIYVSAIFAVLHIGYQSYIDVLFVFGVGLLYGWVFERTRSIIGVSIGHGVANVILFFVAPNLVVFSSLPRASGTLGSLIAAGVTVAIAIGAVWFWRRRTAPDRLSPQ